METRTSGAIAGIRGIRVAPFETGSVKPWASVRPAAVISLPVTAAPTARVLGGEVCPSPDRVPVTPSHQVPSAARAAAPMTVAAFEQNAGNGGYAQAFGFLADGDVPTSKGSIRPAPPG